MNEGSWQGYIRGILAGLAVLSLSQLWLQKEKWDNLQAALFDIKSEMSRNRALLESAKGQTRERAALSAKDGQGLSDNLSTEALRRHRILLAAEDPKYTDILIAYDAEIGALRSREAEGMAYRRKVEQDWKQYDEEIETLVRHRDFLIVNSDKLSSYPDLLKSVQDRVAGLSKNYRLIKENEEEAMSEQHKILLLQIDIVLARERMADAVLAAFRSSANFRKTLLWTAMAAVVIILLGYGVLPIRRTTKSPTNEHLQVDG